MSDLHLIWPGSQTISLLTNVFEPVSKDPLFVALNFEAYIRELLSQNEGVFEVDNKLYFSGDIFRFEVRFILRSGQDQLFPDIFLLEQGIPPVELLREVIYEIISASIELPVQKKFEENWLQTELVFYVNEKVVLTEDFEKTQLGVFFYLLYLQSAFANDPNVCIIISPLRPLIRRAKQLQEQFETMSEQEFKAANPVYATLYEIIMDLHEEVPPEFFRHYMLERILMFSGPYISGWIHPETDEAEIRLNRSFRILFERCQRSSARFSVSYANWFIGKRGHANILIVDNREKIIERYDPNGAVSYDQEVDRVNKEIDRALDEFAKSQGYFYVPPADFCPKLGVQSIEAGFEKTGYCVSWSIIYAEERLRSSKSRSYVATNLLREIIQKNQLRQEDVEETARAVEIWMEKRIEQIFEDMDALFKELSDALGIKLTYQEGRLIYFP